MYRGTTAGGESTTPLNSSPLPSATTGYEDTTVTAGTTYYYVVKTVNGTAASQNSNEASATPSNTINLLAPTNLTAFAASTTEIDLSWTAAASSAVTGYNVFRGTTAGDESITPLNSTPLSSSTTTFHDTTVTAGTTFYYVVEAIDNGVSPTTSGELSSNEASATPSSTTSPLAPTDLSASAVSATEIDLSWAAAAGTVTGYNVYRGTTAGGESTVPLNTLPLSSTATSYHDTSAAVGATYFYVVKAVNGSLVGPNSNEATATTSSNGLAAPTQFTAEDVSASEIDLSWAAAAGTVTGYDVYRGTAIGGESSSPLNSSPLSSTATSYHDTSAAAGTTYFYVVKAVNSSLVGPNSNEATATTSGSQSGVPTVPTLNTPVVVSASQIDLSWTAAAGTVTGYNVYRGTTAGGESSTPLNSTPLSSATTTYQDTTVTAGTQYFYVVKAVDGTVTGASSNEQSATAANTGSGTSLATYYNLTGITTDGKTFSGGLDGGGNALSETLLGTSQTWSGVQFTLGAADTNDVIKATGQTITLTPGQYSKLYFLATGVNGNQPDQTFTVNYTTGSPTTVTQSISDWHTPQAYTGESIAVTSAYRNTSSGGSDDHNYYVYGYSIALDSTRTVSSITLPNDGNVEVLAISTASAVAAPTNLSATAKGTSEIDLSWTAASGTITGYDVYRGTTPVANRARRSNSTPLATTATSYQDTTALAGATYDYTVKALDGPAQSAASNEASATTQALASGVVTSISLSSQYNLAGITTDGACILGRTGQPR